MNKERIIELADKIEQLEHDENGSYSNGINGFCMNYFSDVCGSPSCIAGWAVHMYHPDSKDLLLSGPAKISQSAADLLGIDKHVAGMLFEPNRFDVYNHITPQEASITLRKFAETNIIDWSHSTSYDHKDDCVSDDNSASE